MMLTPKSAFRTVIVIVKENKEEGHMAYLAGLDNCAAGPGSCGVNCGTACDDNQWQWAWPHFSECHGAPTCNANTNVPFYGDVNGNGRCGTNGVRVTCPCTGRAAYPAFKDCGPPPFNSYDPVCQQGGTVVACLNMIAFAYLCVSCNPGSAGIVSISV